MNPARKRLRLTRSPPHPSSPTSTPQLPSHDALCLLSSAATPAEVNGDDEEEEEEGYLLVEEDNTDSSLVATMEDSRPEVMAVRRRAVWGRGNQTEEEKYQVGGASESDEKEEAGEVEIDRQLDQSLETKSKQHNLTTVNVRNIIHEVITNEHVVAMMKAAINETEAVPAFEPKMTRSKFKEVVEKGVVIPAWNISPIKKPCDVNKAPQFVNIPLAEEDSSDEEYHPDEEDEDETAEDTFQESDMESTASSPRGSRLSRGEEDSCSPWQASRSRLRNLRGRSVSMGPPPPPKALPPKTVNDSTFLEKLHAVEEELAVCMEPYQPLSESEDEGGLMAYRTRSKRPLRDVPLGQLEAELQAPDITPDMYDSNSAHEDRDWTDWLRGLMTSDTDNEEECDDDDDPEYNFLADIDEPDVEDYRDDKAVRITKKEVNELMEELFETLKEDLAAQEVDDEGHEEEEEPGEEPREEMHTLLQAHTPLEQPNTGLCGGENGPITELRTVREQLAWVRKKSLTHAACSVDTQCPEPHRLVVEGEQRARLQQQLQQHVQLLTQIHLLTSPVSKLQSEAETTRQFLVELDVLAQRAELLMSAAHPGFCSFFRSSNLQGALQLLEELRYRPISYQSKHHPPDARGYMRCYPVMPAELAWLFATRPVFLYPELLPCASLDPALYCSRRTAAFTAAEDCLLVLGLRNMEESCDPTKMVSQFLLRKTLVQVRRRILQCCRPGVADNIVKVFRYQRMLRPMPVACAPIDLGERRPPVEREESVMPLWLVRSLPVIYPKVKQYNTPPGSAAEAPPTCRWSRPRQSHLTFLRSASNNYSFTPGTRYPPHLPKDLDFRRLGFVLLHPLLAPSTDSSPVPSSPHKPCSPLAARPPRTDSPTDVNATSAVSKATIEQIKSHYQIFKGLRRRSRTQKHNLNTDVEALTCPLAERPTPTQARVEEDNEVLRMNKGEREEEEGSEVLLAVSESTSSAAGSVTDDADLVEEAESKSEQNMSLTLTAQAREKEESRESRTLQLQEEVSSEGSEEETADEDDQREVEDEVFAHDYLCRVCELVKVSPDRSQQLLQVLDQFSEAGPLEASGSLDHLYDRLSCVLQPWPQLLKDFAAFLNRAQAQHCGLSLEQQLFERSRRFLRQLRQSLGESSALYQQVVSVLQGSATPPSADMDKISSLLRDHPDLQEIFQQFQVHLLPKVRVFQNPLLGNSKRVTYEPSEESETGSDGEEGEEQMVCARNISVTSTGEKVIIWTREADRTILKACQRSGATWKTFRLVSEHLGNKTAQQVRRRFQDLMSLFQSATQRSTSCSSDDQPTSRQEEIPDESLDSS